MALTFPSSPSVNDTYTEGGRTWRWNGTTWKVVTGSIVAGAVGASELASSAVTTVKIADLGVTTAKIADGSVTSAKMAAGTGGGLNTGAEGALMIMDIGA